MTFKAFGSVLLIFAIHTHIAINHAVKIKLRLPSLVDTTKTHQDEVRHRIIEPKPKGITAEPIQIALFDFDKTLTMKHVPFSWEQQDLSEEYVVERFGGQHRIIRLKHMFERVRANAIRCGIITRNDEKRVRQSLQRVDLSQYFDEDLLSFISVPGTREAASAKVDFIELVRRRTGLSAQAVVFADDEYLNIEEARSRKTCNAIWIVEPDYLMQQISALLPPP